MARRWKNTNFVQEKVEKIDIGGQIPVLEFSFDKKGESLNMESFLNEFNSLRGSDILDIETTNENKINIQNIVRKQRFSQDVEDILG